MTEQISQQAERRTVQMRRDGFGYPEFSVHIDLGDWTSDRVVTVTDETIDVADLLRRIANKDTGVTEVDRPDGQIIYEEAGGRRVIVGEWRTHESTSCHDGHVAFEIHSPDGRNCVSIDEEVVEGLQIEVERLDGEQAVTTEQRADADREKAELDGWLDRQEVANG